MIVVKRRDVDDWPRFGFMRAISLLPPMAAATLMRVGASYISISYMMSGYFASAASAPPRLRCQDCFRFDYRISPRATAPRPTGLLCSRDGQGRDLRARATRRSIAGEATAILPARVRDEEIFSPNVNACRLIFIISDAYYASAFRADTGRHYILTAVARCAGLTDTLGAAWLPDWRQSRRFLRCYHRAVMMLRAPSRRPAYAASCEGRSGARASTITR